MKKAESGHLQTSLFMQIVTHTIRLMETLLRIPAEYRLDYLQQTDEKNITESVDATIIDAIMRREAGHIDAVRGYGGVAALRDEMHAVTELLRGIPQ